MVFRCFDPQGRPLSWDQLRRLRAVTPVMEHVFATVAERAGNAWNGPGSLAPPPAGGYNEGGNTAPGQEDAT